MRRKSERAAAASKKTKQSPEKKLDKAKRTRSRRSRKQSSSSENDSAEETSPVREETIVEPVQQPPTTPVKEDSPEEAQESVWHVKAADTSGDMGEIKKLKICLTRPPSTPERVDRSPRSKRKHSRATSSSDTPSNEGSEEKKKKHRSKRSTRESKDESDKNQDSQGEEPDVEHEVQETVVHPESEESKSTVPKQDSAGDNVPMSTTSEVAQPQKASSESSNQEQEKANKEDNTEKPSEAADTTVTSPKAESEVQDKSKTNESEEKQQPMRERSESIDKSDLLELHPEEAKCESMELGKGDEEEKSAGDEKVSISEDKKDVSQKKVAESKNASNNATNANDVVERSERVANEKSRRVSVESDKDKDGDDIYRNIKVERSDSIQSAQEETVCNGQSAPIVINRKRKWGSRSSKLTTQKSITISTDVLKDIIPDVKPVEFDEVIDEKKHRRVEMSERLERPVLPKIVIDNTESVEKHKKDQEEKDKARESNLTTNRKISIVNDENLARPPSPPRNKQSHILYITNLVRPFTLPQLKNLLQRTGRIAEDGFWIDRIKSKCYVKYETEDQAIETRHALHGVTWPVSNPKVLQVDFSTQEAFDKAKSNEETDNAQTSTIPGTVEDWLREQDMKRQRGEVETKPWERKAAMREWDVGKNDKDKVKELEHIGRKDDRLDKRRHHTSETSPEPAKKFKKKEEEAPAKLLDDLFRKTKATPCIYWLPLSAETIAVKEEQRRQHMAEHERRLQEMRRTQRDRDRRH